MHIGCFPSRYSVSLLAQYYLSWTSFFDGVGVAMVICWRAFSKWPLEGAAIVCGCEQIATHVMWVRHATVRVRAAAKSRAKTYPRPPPTFSHNLGSSSHEFNCYNCPHLTFTLFGSIAFQIAEWKEEIDAKLLCGSAFSFGCVNCCDHTLSSPD